MKLSQRLDQLEKSAPAAIDCILLVPGGNADPAQGKAMQRTGGQWITRDLTPEEITQAQEGQTHE